MAKQKINQQQYSRTFSTSEALTGDVWIDGKPIYVKTISIGAMPNTTTKSVAHGVTTIESIVTMYGAATTGTTNVPLPYAVTTANQAMQINRAGANIDVTTGLDRSGWTGYVTIEYTKV